MGCEELCESVGSMAVVVFGNDGSRSSFAFYTGLDRQMLLRLFKGTTSSQVSLAVVLRLLYRSNENSVSMVLGVTLISAQSTRSNTLALGEAIERLGVRGNRVCNQLRVDLPSGDVDIANIVA